MYTKICLMTMMLALGAAAVVQAVPVVSYYYDGQLMSLVVDSTQMCVLFQDVEINQGIDRVLANYGNLSYDPDDQVDIEDFQIFDLDDPAAYDDIMAALREEPYVGLVHPIILYYGVVRIYVSQTIIVRFYDSMEQAEIDCLLEEYQLEFVEENPWMSNEYLFAVTSETPYTIFDVANEIYEMPPTDYSHPNMYAPIIPDKAALNSGYGQAAGQSSATAVTGGVHTDAWYRLVRGVVEDDGHIDVNDAVYLINYVFRHGPQPVPHILMGDANCDGCVNIGDIVNIIHYIFRDGRAPRLCCQFQP